MKNILQGVVVAFSMYSAIKMPHVDWNKENMRFAICYFPLVGMTIGFLMVIWLLVSQMFQISAALFSALAVVLPIAVSGGIHFDGFIDTCDALASNQPLERKLQILKDSHVGAFAIITSLIYCIVAFGLWNEIYNQTLPANQIEILLCLFLIPVLSRALCGVVLVTYPCAKESGLAHMFASSSDKKIVRNSNLFFCMLCLIAIITHNVFLGLLFFVFMISFYMSFKAFTNKNFGGLTGDLSGYFIQMMELLLLVVVACYMIVN